MPELFWILISTFSVSLISFIGVLFLFLKENILNKALVLLVAFSAGALLGAAFFDLLPEAGFSPNIFIYLILGFCAFFVLEQFIGWHHHHASRHPELKSFSYLILISDGIHNFLDGLIIAGSYLAGIPVGIAATVAVIFHEIPQEIGDFGILIFGGVKKARALLLNFLSAASAILGGILGFFFFEKMSQGLSSFLSFSAGAFIYIAASDLIPQIKEETQLKKSLLNFLAFLAGIALIYLLTLVFA